MTPLTSVLIVDDEPAVRDLMSRWVDRARAARPQTAANADEALATLRDPPLRPRRHRRDDAGTRRPVARRTRCSAITRTRPSSSRRPIRSSLGDDAKQRPIADLLIKPFQRERFALAVDRGRQWRKQALEEVHWHAVLSIELRDRAAQVIARARTSGARRRVSEPTALIALPLERMPDIAAHGERVARYAQSVARELGVERELGADARDRRRAFTTSARWRCPKRCSRSRRR